MRYAAAILVVALAVGEVQARGGRLRIFNRNRQSVSQPTQPNYYMPNVTTSPMQCGPQGCFTIPLSPAPSSAARAVVYQDVVPSASPTAPAASQPPKPVDRQPPPAESSAEEGASGWRDAYAKLTIRVDALEQDLQTKTTALQEQIDLQVQKLELKIKSAKQTAATARAPVTVRAVAPVQRAPVSTAPRPTMSAAQLECERKARILANGRRLYHPRGPIHGTFEGVGMSSSPHNVPTCTPRRRGSVLVGDATAYGNGRYWRVRQWR